MSAHLHDHPFKFYRVRGGSEERIYPHAGARLHFGSREADSLSLPTLPVGTLAAGDQVKVTYEGVGSVGSEGSEASGGSTSSTSTTPSTSSTVFIGTVEKRVLRKTGGSEQTENVTVLGPWSKMARLVYRQGWLSMGAAARSSRLILNQTQGGAPQNLNSELNEIAQHAAQACGYAVGTISVSTQVLPSDECRDITVADAIRRELRLFPKAVARFDYSSGTPTLVIEKPSTSSTSSTYSTVSKSEREIEYDEHPITGVDLQIDEAGEIDGVGYLNIAHQTAGDTAADNPDCLYATLQIKGASSNTVRQSFKSITEDPNSGGQWKTKGWWKQKHPRLANVALDAITINPADCLCDGANALPADCPRISAATAGELEEAGLMCRVCKFTAKATIETDDDKEEALYLTMHFLMTNATGTAEHPKTYTWVAESSSESGESVPAGLAAAILAERCGRIRSEKMTVRLGETFPAIGDTITDEDETLPLQSIDVDCADLTADLVFGAPEYLSPEDMAALLSNFRNKRTTSSSSLRKTGKTEDQGSNVEMGGIPPLSSTEFQPGTKAHTTIKSASGSGGSIDLDSKKVEDGETIEVHDLIIKGEKEEDDKTFKVLSDKDVEIPAGGASGVTSLNLLTGALTILGGKSVRVEVIGKNAVRISVEEGKEPDPVPTPPTDPCDHPGDKPGSEGGVPAEDSSPGSGYDEGDGVPADEDTHAGEPCPDCSPTK